MGNVAAMAEAWATDDRSLCAQIGTRGSLRGGELAKSESFAWFALSIHQYKRERCEHMLAQLGYEHFSPCTETVREWSDRRKRALDPLFPGYIFCRFNPEQRVALLKIPGIRGIVGSGKQLREVDAAEIEAIRVAVASRLPMDPFPALMPGQRVKVTDGPLCGLEGVLVRVKTQSRLLLSVSMLNRCVSIEVEAHHLAIQH
jgi:transcription antitermination factor NusG